jgi:uncharacterized BrkB/YihY/UPF0761 family membrane protein
MPQPDPTPRPRHPVMRRFWRIFRLLVLLSVVIAGIAVALVARGDPTMHVNKLIATALGTGFTVLIGTGLMTLVFISSSSGHDEAVSSFHEENDQE